MSAPTPEAANSAGLTWAQRWLIWVVSSVDFGGEGLISAGQETEDLFGVSDGGVTITGTETGAGPGFGGAF